MLHALGTGAGTRCAPHGCRVGRVVKCAGAMWAGALLLAGILRVVSAQGGATCPQAAPSPGAEALWTELSSASCSPTQIGSCCPTGWETAPQVGDTCYKFSNVAVSLSAGEAVCASFGAQLLHIVDSAQQFFVAQRLAGHSAWLGMRGDDPQSLKWTDGRRSAYSRMWHSRTHASATDAEQYWPADTAACAKLCSSNDVTCNTGDWDAVLCDAALHYVCQKPSGHPRAYTTWTNTQSDSMTAGDDGWIDVVLPFPFLFFGELFGAGDLIRASANGYITVGADSSHNLYGHTHSFPNSDSPNAVLAAFWTDLYPAGVEDGGGLYSLAETDRLVIEWREIPFWIPYREQGFCDNTAHADVCGRTVTFELVLHRDGSVQMLYMECDELPHPAENYPDHAPLAIGFENMDGTTGVNIIGSRSYTMNMTGLVISIPQSCHSNLPFCAARTANETAVCEPPAGRSSGTAGGSGSAGGGWVQVDPRSGATYYHASWHWGPSFALLMSFIVSIYRLYKVVTEGHIWRGHWISVENDAATIQAMLAAARAGGRGVGTVNALSSAEMASLVRLSSEQLREPAQRHPLQADASPAGRDSPSQAVAGPDYSPRSSPALANPITLPETPSTSTSGNFGDSWNHLQAGGQTRNFGNDLCAICMCSMLEPDVESTGTEADVFAPSLVQLTCLHVFHAECAEQWLQRSRECPVCKRDAVRGDGSADREAAARAHFAAQASGDQSTDEDETSGGISDQDRSEARRSITALGGGYRSCDRSTLIVCLACVTGLFITTASEISFVQHCKTQCVDGHQPELDLRCGFFVAISLVSFAMATVAMAALHTPVHRRCLWDGFCGWCLYSMVVVSISTSWYDKVLSAHEDDCDTYVKSDEQLQEVSLLPSVHLARLRVHAVVHRHCGGRWRALTVPSFWIAGALPDGDICRWLDLTAVRNGCRRGHTAHHSARKGSFNQVVPRRSCNGLSSHLAGSGPRRGRV